MPTKKCTKCGKLFKVGYNGLSNGICDGCQGVERDERDFVWLPGESEMLGLVTDAPLSVPVDQIEAQGYTMRIETVKRPQTWKR